MKLTIKQLNNGWLLEGTGGDFPLKEAFVYNDECEEKISLRNRLKALQSLFYAVKDYLGEFGSKHDAYRLFIEIRDQQDKEAK